MDHKEVGYHITEKSLSLCTSVVTRWEDVREMENLPDAPDILGETFK